MLQLLQPIWLAAMAGIVGPVLLHLWNDRQGKVLPVGSIALLEKRSPRRTWSRRLSEWLLLLLRCLLLMALALLLAGPSWRRGVTAEEKGWILGLGDGAGLGEAGSGEAGSGDATGHYKPLVDSLLKAGYERHAWTGVDEDAAVRGRSSYWDAFRAADRVAPAGAPFYIFTPGWASRFHGSRPSTDRVVHWYTYTPADSVSHWIANAWASSPDSVRIAEGSSQPTGTSYTYRMAAAGQLSVKVDSQAPVMVDTAEWRIAIYADADHRQDSRYLAAAIRALGQFSRRRIGLSVTDKIPAIRPDWLFWLSSEAIPAGDMAGHLLLYEPGKTISVDTRMQGVDGVEIGKEIGDVSGTGGPAGEATTLGVGLEAVWKDGYGRPLLGLERRAHGGMYHFFSRFDPGWNGLAWSRSLPVLLSDLLSAGDTTGNVTGDRRDRRVLDPEQIVPVKRMGTGMVKGVGTGVDGSIAGVGSSVAGSGGSFDLAPVCWILIVLLFILERVVSFNTAKTK